MNKLLVLAFLSSMISLQAIQWHTFEEGLLEAKKSHKLVMLDIVRDKCHYCVDMDKHVFNDAKMKTWIESCFVPVKLNLSHDVLPKGIKAEVTPTFIFMTSEQVLVKKILGSWNKDDFKDLSEKLCQEY